MSNIMKEINDTLKDINKLLTKDAAEEFTIEKKGNIELVREYEDSGAYFLKIDGKRVQKGNKKIMEAAFREQLKKSKDSKTIDGPAKYAAEDVVKLIAKKLKENEEARKEIKQFGLNQIKTMQNNLDKFDEDDKREIRKAIVNISLMIKKNI